MKFQQERPNLKLIAFDQQQQRIDTPGNLLIHWIVIVLGTVRIQWDTKRRQRTMQRDDIYIYICIWFGVATGPDNEGEINLN